MKSARVICLFVAALIATSRLVADDFFDQVADLLTISAFHDNIRARISGLLDLEVFGIDQPPPGLIDTDQGFLVNPRLTIFLDAQLGSQIYFFAQARLDRGFDPSDNGAQVRLDEYALRLTPWNDGRFVFQVGKFATVVGNWVKRHHSWENPFINAPLPYENLTAASDILVPVSAQDFLSEFTPSERYEHNPVIWGPSYTSGFSVAGRLDKFDYAIEVKNAALASRPGSWSATPTNFDYPSLNGRAGWQPNESWNLGISAGSGSYLRAEAAPLLSPGRNRGDYRELLLGQDLSFAWRHLQMWAEVYEVRFQVPRVGNADTVVYYLEGKYKFGLQLFGALRWNQQLFGTVPDGDGNNLAFGHDLWRIDAALGYRFTAHTQLKLQYSLQNQTFNSGELGHMFAAQFTARF